MTTLAEDLVLLAAGARRKIGPRTGTLPLRFHYGVRGAELVSLALAGRVEVADGRIVLRDSNAPLNDPVLNILLAELGKQPPPPVNDWIATAESGLSEYYFDRLAAAGALQVVSYRLLLIARVRGYELVDVAGFQDARRRLDAAVLSQGPLDSAQSALAGLAYAAGLDDLCYPGSQGKAARDRMKELATGGQGAAAAAAAAGRPDPKQSTWHPYPVLDPNLLNPDPLQGGDQSGGHSAAQAAAQAGAQAAGQAGQAAARAGADAAVHAAAHAAVHASVTAAVSAATQTAHSHHSGSTGSDSGGHHHSSGSSDSGGGHHH